MKRKHLNVRNTPYRILFALPVFLLVMALGLYTCNRSLRSYTDLQNRERAATVSRHITTEIMQLVESAVLSMETVEKMMIGDMDRDLLALRSLQETKLFSDVGILNGNVFLRADGSLQRIDASEQGASYSVLYRSGRLIIQPDIGIQIRIPLQDGGFLLAWIDSQHIEQILHSAFPEPYDWMVYNANTGTYLVNHTKFPGNSYYDALRSLNRDARASELMRIDNGEARFVSEKGAYYIAQRETFIRPWNIALILPEVALSSDKGLSSLFVVFFLATVAILLAMFVLLLLRYMCRIRSNAQDAKRAQNERDSMLYLIAKESRMALILYNRRKDSLLRLYDGMNLFEDKRDSIDVEELIQSCNMDEADAERIRSLLMEQGTGECKDCIVRCESDKHEERLLHFVFSSLGTDDRVVLCSLRDCTLEQLARERLDKEREYLDANRNKSISIWEIDAAEDRWRALELKKNALAQKHSVTMNVWRDYSADIKQIIGKNCIATDFDELYNNISPAHIVEMAHIGQTEFCYDFRLSDGSDGSYQWRRLKMRIYTEFETNRIHAIVYFSDIDAEKLAEYERNERRRISRLAMLAARGIFDIMYYVDLENNLCYMAKSHGGAIVSELSMPYLTTMNETIENRVHPNQRVQLHKLLSPYALKQSLTEGAHCIRRRLCVCIDDREQSVDLILQPARFENGTLRELLIALVFIEGDDRAGVLR